MGAEELHCLKGLQKTLWGGNISDMEQLERKGRGRPRKTDDDHTKIKSINITTTQKAALTAYAKATGKPISQLVDEWIREELHEDTYV